MNSFLKGFLSLFDWMFPRNLEEQMEDLDFKMQELYDKMGQWLFLSYYHGDTNYSNYDDWFWNREPNRYSTQYLAQETIKALIHEKKSKRIKLLKCVQI